MKQKLIAVRPLTYATRRLQAGDEFEASSQDARVLIAVKRAKSVDEASEPGPAPSSQPPMDDIAALRDEYLAAIGKRPFNGWDAAELRKRISAANG